MIDAEKQFGTAFEEMADLAGVIALKYFRKSFSIEEKEDKTPVTQADREIEEKLREYIRRKFPAHGIIGEEFGSENENAEWVWVCDPIDGTKAFASGRPTFGTIIGLAHQGKPLMGLIEHVALKERWFAADRQFCRYNGVPAKVASPRALSAARFHATTPDMFHGGYEKNFDALRKAVKWAQYSCDCYAYGLLASGWLDLVMERQMKVPDLIGLVPVITGAGGFVSDWQGKPIGLSNNGTIVAASSENLAQEALSVINRVS